VKIEAVQLPEPRYTLGGDEFVFVELDQEMSFQANFRSMAVCNELRARGLPGVTEICPGNASYLVRLDPDTLHPRDLIAELQGIDEQVAHASHLTLSTRVVDVPVLLEDPWTREMMDRFPERRQDPTVTDVEFAARLNGYETKEDFLRALVGSPYYVSMVGFVPGTPWCFQMVPRQRTIQVPKYIRPRTDTPPLTFGYGGAFGCIYPVRGPGGFQMFGIFAAPIFDPQQRLPDFADLIVFPRPGDIFRFRPVERDEYDVVRAQVEEGTFRYQQREVEFDPEAFFADPDAYNAEVVARLDS
jgi:urea carboxylase